MKLILPILRANLKLDEIYQDRDLEFLDYPITVFSSSKDLEITSEALEDWKKPNH